MVIDMSLAQPDATRKRLQGPRKLKGLISNRSAFANSAKWAFPPPTNITCNLQDYASLDLRNEYFTIGFFCS
jgi:hypothetical protein